jgi:hypothetical protein
MILPHACGLKLRARGAIGTLLGFALLLLLASSAAAQEGVTRGEWPAQSFTVSYGQPRPAGESGGLIGVSSAFRMRVTVTPTYELPGDGMLHLKLGITSEDLIETREPMSLAALQWGLARQEVGQVAQMRIMFDRGTVTGQGEGIFPIPQGASRIVGLELVFKHEYLSPREWTLVFGGSKAVPIILAGVLVGLGGANLVRRRPPRRTAVLDAADLRAEVDADKAKFEQLQQALKDKVNRELANVRAFNQAFDDKWAQAMDELGRYMKEYPALLPGLTDLMEQLGNRDFAREAAKWADTALTAAMIGQGIARAGLGAIRRTGAQTVKPIRGMASEIRPGATPGPRGPRRRPRSEAHRPAKGSISKLADEAVARQEAKAATEAAVRQERAALEKEILATIEDVNVVPELVGEGKLNCVSTALATDRCLAGFPTSAIRSKKRLKASWLEQHFKKEFHKGQVAKGEAGEIQIRNAMEKAGDGARGIVAVEQIVLVEEKGVLKEVRVWHSFNVANRKGHVFFPDGQKCNFFNGWKRVERVQWIRTN